jgi:co-chaperonin GroES (HSP10)
MIVPTGKAILVKPDPVETTTASGIVVALDESQEKAKCVSGTVVALGELAFKEFLPFQGIFKAIYEPYAVVGSRIQFRRYTGVGVVDPDTQEEFLLMNDTDVLSRFEKEKKNV